MLKQDVDSYTNTCRVSNPSQVSSSFRRIKVVTCVQVYLETVNISSCLRYVTETSLQIMRDLEIFKDFHCEIHLKTRCDKKKNGSFTLVSQSNTLKRQSLKEKVFRAALTTNKTPNDKSASYNFSHNLGCEHCQTESMCRCQVWTPSDALTWVIVCITCS